LYAEGASELGYMEGIYSRVYARGRNEVVYIEFAGCRRSVLLIAENRSAHAPSKIGIG
jgi:hypothetical protein